VPHWGEKRKARNLDRSAAYLDRMTREKIQDGLWSWNKTKEEGKLEEVAARNEKLRRVSAAKKRIPAQVAGGSGSTNG